MKYKENCEDGNRQCNMENVLKGHIIPSHKNEIRYVDSKYHTTTHRTKRHMKIYSRENPYHCSLCGKGSISRSHINNHMKSHARENLCEREFISWNHPKRYSKRNTGKNPYHCILCGKGLISMIKTKRHMKSVLCSNIIVKT